MVNEPRFQSSIGTVYERRYRGGSNIDRISFARVVKVNYRYNTVDVVSVKGDYQTGSSGRLSAQLPVQFGGTTRDGKPFGQINPIEVGTYVLVGFVDGKKTSPVVLAVYGGEEESMKLSRTPFEEVDPDDEELKRLSQQQFTVYPSLTYEGVDGAGNRTVSFTGKSFVTTEAGSNPEVGGIDDDEEGTEYEDLDTSYYYTGELIEPKENRAPVILFKHQGDEFARNEDGYKKGSHTFMWFLDDDGTYRTSIMQEDEDWRSHFEMTPEGTIQMVRQNDSKRLNSTSDVYSIGVEKDGIRIRVGDRYSLITPEGTFGNLGIGLGGGTLPEDVKEKIDNILDLNNRTILRMETYLIKTDGYISMGADLLEEIEGGMREYKSNFTILAQEIRSSVRETEIKDLLDQELGILTKKVDELAKEADEQLEIVKDLVSDGRLTPEEKAVLQTGYQNIRLEYTAYIEQAKRRGEDEGPYKKAYENLIDIMAPIMSNPSEITRVNPTEIINAYVDYYSARQRLITSILYTIQEEVMQAVDETNDAAIDASNALVGAAHSLGEAERILKWIKGIADSDKITPEDKRKLQRELEVIRNDHKRFEKQAGRNGVSIENFNSSYEEMLDYIDRNRIDSNLGQTEDINGQYLYDVFEKYFKERVRILNEIAKETKERLEDLHVNFERHQTEIVETSNQISLVAESVFAAEESIRVALARLTVMSDRIQSTVSSTTVKREVDENRNTLNATGKNLYAKTTAVEGNVLSPNTGEVEQLSQGATSDIIRVSGGAKYTGSVYNNTGTNTLVIAYYTRKLEFIEGNSLAVSRGNEYEELETTAPSNASVARVSVDNRETLDVQFERGNSSGFYMYANEDLINNLEFATDEKIRREIAWKDKNTRMISKADQAATIRSEVEHILGKDSISISDVNSLIDTIDNLKEANDAIITEAEELDILTINIEMAMGALMGVKAQYLEPIASGDKEGLTNLERQQTGKRFEDYLTRSGNYYKQVNDKFEIAYDAAVEVLDEVLAGSLEAERIAREAAIAAERAAQNVSTLEQQIVEGEQEREIYLQVLREISRDGYLSPVDKEKGVSIKKVIDEEMEWLVAQGMSVSMSTNDINNAHLQLDSYFSQYVTPEGMLRTNKINAQTFVDSFDRYFTAKLYFLDNLLKEARRRLVEREQEAKLARDETLRRDDDLQVIKNIVTDSERAIKKIEEKVDIIESAQSFAIELLSTNGFTFKDRIVDTTLEVTVRRNAEDITDEIPDRNFEWKKVDANGEEDVAWGYAHKGVGRAVSLSHEDIQGRATFTVEVYMDKEEQEE